MSNVKITGVSVVRDKPWANGGRLLCFFDAEINGFSFFCCLLIRTADGDLWAQLPMIPNQRGENRAVRIIDPDIRTVMAEEAWDAYAAFLKAQDVEAAE